MSNGQFQLAHLLLTQESNRRAAIYLNKAFNTVVTVHDEGICDHFQVFSDLLKSLGRGPNILAK